MIVTGKYLGDLCVEAKHLLSGTTMVTDAPPERGGEGRSFSPTDLCAMSAAMCALSVMGLYAKQNGLDIDGTTYSVAKTMSENPRRIAKIEITFSFPPRDYSDADKQALARAVDSCPVKLSLHPETLQLFTFNWAN